MKPAFALSFSSTGLSLRHHSDDDWYTIGAVSLDAPDLTDQIQDLREKAFALENDLSCKVIVPDDQIRYLSVATEGLSAEDSEQKVYEALAAATPYELSELSFDTATQGTTVQVAAVARQTLDEASTFVKKHGFIPVLFSADATEAEFSKDPNFELDVTSPPVVITTPIAAYQPQAPDEAEITQEPAAPEDTAEPPEPGPTVHAIAQSADPDAFRSAGLLDPLPEIGTPEMQQTKPRYVLPAIAATLLLGVSVTAWTLFGSGGDEAEPEQASAEVPQADTNAQSEPDTQVATVDQPETSSQESPPAAEDQPELSSTDAAILEALNVPPTPVEQIEIDPEAQEDFKAATGLNITPPAAPTPPAPVQTDELYLASVNNPDLSSDAIALPPAASFETDQPFTRSATLNLAGTNFDLDERGLVTPTPEGALNPEGILVYQGRPSSVPPDVPVRFEEEPVVDEADLRLAGLRPRGRPEDLGERFERQQLGGRSKEELAVLRPKLRPESLQAKPQVDETPTALAVVRVPRPKVRPSGLAAQAARAPSGNTSNLGSTAAVNQSNDEAGSFTPKTVAPKIPSTASVARQATIDNAINLRRLNLIGVYGTPANRRALVRLPSGRYKKLKVGDRIDGGKVIAISDTELRYQKKGRNLTLSMPRG